MTPEQRAEIMADTTEDPHNVQAEVMAKIQAIEKEYKMRIKLVIVLRSGLPVNITDICDLPPGSSEGWLLVNVSNT